MRLCLQDMQTSCQQLVVTLLAMLCCNRSRSVSNNYSRMGSLQTLQPCPHPNLATLCSSSTLYLCDIKRMSAMEMSAWTLPASGTEVSFIGRLVHHLDHFSLCLLPLLTTLNVDCRLSTRRMINVALYSSEFCPCSSLHVLLWIDLEAKSSCSTLLEDVWGSLWPCRLSPSS